MPKFSEKSLSILATCDPRLQKLLNAAIRTTDFTIICGKRSEADAAKTRAEGKSQTTRSKHVYPLGALSLACDVAPWPVDWKDTGRFYYLAGVIQTWANHLGIKIRGGWDWDGDGDFHDSNFPDLGHVELVE